MKEKIKQNKIFFLCFAVVVLSSVTTILSKGFDSLMNSDYYPLYALDYSIGFCSRILVGSVISLFTDQVNLVALKIALIVIYFLVCAFVCYLINKVLKGQSNNIIFIFTAVFLISPYFTSIMRYFGTMDIFWLLCMVLSFYLADKKYARWLIPIICVAGSAFHNAFILAYLPVIAVFVLYNFAKNPDKKSLAFVIVTSVFALASAVYFVIFADSTVHITQEQLLDTVNQRLGGVNFNKTYIIFSLFNDNPQIEQLNGFGEYIKFMLWYTAETSGITSNVGLYLYMFLSTVIFAVPVYVLSVRMIKKAEKPLMKFIYALPFVYIPALAVCVLTSTDTDRFISTFLFSLLFTILMYAKNSDKAFNDSLDELYKKIKSKKAVAIIVAAMLVVFIAPEVL